MRLRWRSNSFCTVPQNNAEWNNMTSPHWWKNTHKNFFRLCGVKTDNIRLRLNTFKFVIEWCAHLFICDYLYLFMLICECEQIKTNLCNNIIYRVAIERNPVLMTSLNNIFNNKIEFNITFKNVFHYNYRGILFTS